MTSIDLNADVGEGFGAWSLGDDAGLMELISSANIACGFHAGDPMIMRRSCELAAQRGVAIGAQVGYRDLAGFGRRRLDIEADELSADVLYQIGALAACARAAGSRVAYVKPHGALYNTVITDALQAAAVVAAITAYDDSLPVLTLAGSALADAASAAGVRVVGEFFADRAYRPDGTLQPRSQAGAVLREPKIVAERVVRMALHRCVVSIDGSIVPVRAESICVHGDSPNAAELARSVRSALTASGFRIAAFSSA